MTELVIAQIVVTVLSAAITGGASYLMLGIRNRQEKRERKEAEQEKQEEMMVEGLKALLRSEIRKQAEQGITAGYASIKDKEIMELTYKPYHGLGGNSVATELYETYMALPLKPIENQ